MKICLPHLNIVLTLPVKMKHHISYCRNALLEQHLILFSMVITLKNFPVIYLCDIDIMFTSQIKQIINSLFAESIHSCFQICKSH